MNLVKSIEKCYEKYTDFQGRASRSEFWYFALYASISGTLINSIYFAYFYGNPTSIWLFFLIQLFAFTIPHLAAFSRRLHDVNKSGWWYLLVFTVVGFPILIYWVCLKGNASKNKYGAPINLPSKSLVSKSIHQNRYKSKSTELQIRLNKNTAIYAALFCVGLLFLFFGKNYFPSFSGSTHSLSSVRQYYCPTKDDMYACSSACEYKWNTHKDDKVVIDVSSNSVTRYEFRIIPSTGISELVPYSLKQCYFDDRNNWICLDDYQNEYRMTKGRYTETFHTSSKPVNICFSDGLFNLFR
jgi:uncharacterized membrane protein YhaH (DUF805 family)